MKILVATSEAIPFAKTGGLADVTGTLPEVLAKAGHDVRLVLPAYKVVKTWLSKNPDITVHKIGNVDVPVKDMHINGIIEKFKYKNTVVYLIGNDNYYNREELYAIHEQDYHDNAERFAFFSHAILKMLKYDDWIPDIIHLNDWQTSPVAVFLKTLYRDDSYYSRIATILTIHNLRYQGKFPASELGVFAGVNIHEIFTMDKLEFYGDINFLKGGIVYADMITTVSKKYAEEIQTKEYGKGLEGVLRYRSDYLVGILNGIDYDFWNPANDKYISYTYDYKKLDNKRLNKIEIIQQYDITTCKDHTPLLGMVTRLTEQKGLDILEEIFDELFKLDVVFILLGSGDEYYHKILKDIAEKYKGRISINFGYNEALAHKIYAASDMFLMPSKYEPCGLGQLISLRYGSVPVVRKTGGLSDTIKEFDPLLCTGNGFVFLEYTGEALLQAIKRACYVYKHKKDWKRCVLNGMKEDYSWEVSAAEYIKLYRRVVNMKKV